MAVNLGTAVAYIDMDYSGFGKGVTAVNTQLAGLSKNTSSVVTAFNNVGKTLSNVGKTLTLSVTAPLVAVGTAAVKTGMDFDSSMSKVKAISGATGKEFDLLREKAIQMGAKTKFSAVESADAFTFMAQAGWTTHDMLEGIDGVMNLAAADGIELAIASSIVTDSITAFGLSAKDSARFADVLARAAADTNTDVTQLGEAFKYTAPIAGTLGYSIEDVSLALGLMSNAGIKSSQAGTTLRSALTNLVNPTNQMTAALDELGLMQDGVNTSMINADGSMKPLKETLQILREKFAGLSEAEQAQMASTIFGKQAMSGMLAVINSAPGDFDALVDSLENADGSALEMAETMQDNLAGSVEEMSGAIETFGIRISDILTPKIRGVVDKITEFVDKLSQLDSSTLETIVTIAGLVAAVGPMLFVFGKVISVVTTVVTTFGKIKAAILAFKAGIAIAGGAAGTTTGIMGGLGAAIGSITAPVWIVIGAIAALVAGFVYVYNTSEDVRKQVSKLVDTVGTILSQAFLFVSEEVLPAIIGAFNEFMKMIQPLVNFVKNVLVDAFSNILLPALNRFAKFVSEQIMPMLQNLLNNVFIPLGNFLKAVFTPIINVLAAVLNFLWPIISTVAKTIIDILFSALNFIMPVINTFISIVGMIITVFTEVINIVVPILNVLWETVATIFTTIWNVISTTLTTIWDVVSTIFNTILNIIVGTLTTIWEAVVSYLTFVWEFWSTILTEIWNVVSSIFGAIFNIIFGTLMSIFESVMSIFQFIFDVVFNTLSALFDFISEIFTRIWDIIVLIITPVIEFFNMIWGGISSAFDTAISFFTDIFTNVWNAIVNAFATVTSFFSGLWEAIKAPFSSVVSWFTGVFTSAWQGVKNVFNTGGNIFNGIKEGIAGVFTTVVNGIIGGINSVIKVPFDAVNKVLNTVRNFDVPVVGQVFKGLWKQNPLTVPQIPQLAKGGILPKGKTGFLEGDGAEAVIPLDQNTGWIKKQATELFGHMRLFFKSEFKNLFSFEPLINALNDINNGLLAVSNSLNSLSYAGINNSYSDVGIEREKEPNDKKETKIVKQINETYIFNSDKKIDEAEAARQLRIAKRDLDQKH